MKKQTYSRCGLKENMKKIMFDTNSFDKILTGEIPIELIKKSVSLGCKYFITHIQTDELSRVPDTKKWKREKLVLFLTIVSPSLIPTESFVLGYSKLGFAKFPSTEIYLNLSNPTQIKEKKAHYETLLNKTRSNVKDAIIGETAIKNGFTLVTEDARFINKVDSLGGIAITPKNFTDKLRKEKNDNAR